MPEDNPGRFCVLTCIVMHLKWIAPVLISAAALGQQAVPDPGEAEKALRDRVQQFYQLQVEKKYRQAEAFIANDTKDLFYASGKPDLAGFSIVKVVMKDGGTRAEVTVKGKVSMFIMGQGMVPMDLPTTGTWKIEDGQWVWYVDPAAGVTTPFGNMKPAAAPAEPSVAGDVSQKIKNFDVKAISNSVTLDTSNVVLASDQSSAAATITNGMPGPVELMLLANPIKGFAIDLDKTQLKAGEVAKVVFTRKGSAGEASGHASVLVSPLDLRLEIQFTAH
jgi:hypothetical protein